MDDDDLPARYTTAITLRLRTRLLNDAEHLAARRGLSLDDMIAELIEIGAESVRKDLWRPRPSTIVVGKPKSPRRPKASKPA